MGSVRWIKVDIVERDEKGYGHEMHYQEENALMQSRAPPIDQNIQG